jgi:hypothetical protein
MLAAVSATLGGGLGGCAATTDFTYSEYQLGQGFQNGRVYERRIYGDTNQGFGSEECRVVVRRQVDAFGEISTREETVCEEF